MLFFPDKQEFWALDPDTKTGGPKEDQLAAAVAKRECNVQVFTRLDYRIDGQTYYGEVII